MGGWCAKSLIEGIFLVNQESFPLLLIPLDDILWIRRGVLSLFPYSSTDAQINVLLKTEPAPVKEGSFVLLYAIPLYGMENLQLRCATMDKDILCCCGG